jgi:hypothetical protein
MGRGAGDSLHGYIIRSLEGHDRRVQLPAVSLVWQMHPPSSTCPPLVI